MADEYVGKFRNGDLGTRKYNNQQHLFTYFPNSGMWISHSAHFLLPSDEYVSRSHINYKSGVKSNRFSR